MNHIELLRKRAVKDLLSIGTMQKVWPVWRTEILGQQAGHTIDGVAIREIGNRLYDVFKSTGNSGRGQGDLSAGGTAWECLVCWYLNLCLLGSNTVVIKHKKSLIPGAISDAVTVKYGTVSSNTESDLLAITFPTDSRISASEIDDRYDQARLVNELDKVVVEKFDQTSLTIIQCKTNWNDNAQIPMLWDLIYSSTGFNANASVGQNGFTVSGLRRFRYAFATVPTTDPKNLKPASVAVLRVNRISGGNYWGLPTKDQVASNVFDLIHKNLPETFNAGAWNAFISDRVRVQIRQEDYFSLLP